MANKAIAAPEFAADQKVVQDELTAAEQTGLVATGAGKRLDTVGVDEQLLRAKSADIGGKLHSLRQTQMVAYLNNIAGASLRK